MGQSQGSDSLLHSTYCIKMQSDELVSLYFINTQTMAGLKVVACHNQYIHAFCLIGELECFPFSDYIFQGILLYAVTA